MEALPSPAVPEDEELFAHVCMIYVCMYVCIYVCIVHFMFVFRNTYIIAIFCIINRCAADRAFISKYYKYAYIHTYIHKYMNASEWYPIRNQRALGRGDGHLVRTIYTPHTYIEETCSCELEHLYLL